jgi:hypothetical protein
MQIKTSETKPINASGSEATPNRVDLFSGRHTTPITVAILFVITLIAFIIVFCVKDNLSETVITAFFSLMSIELGFLQVLGLVINYLDCCLSISTIVSLVNISALS